MPKKQTKGQLTLDILRQARQLIAKGWTKGQMAATKSGRQADTKSEAACRFCAMGAVGRAYMDVTGEKDNVWFSNTTRDIFKFLEELLDQPSISKFNDDQLTKKPVLALFDKAIAKLEAKNA